MALEDLTGSDKYVANLVITNPLSADDRREGDDHIRGIKNVLKNSFPTLAGPVTFSDYVLKAGDTMTGQLTIAAASGSPLLFLDRQAGTAESGVIGKRLGVTRWMMLLGNSAAESSGNAGSDFTLTRFNDAGVALAASISIVRSNGNVGIGSNNVSISSLTGSAASMLTLNQIGSGGFAGISLLNPGGGKSIRTSPTNLLEFVNWAGTNTPFQFDDVGNAYKLAAGTAWLNVSDGRLKERVKDYTPGLDAILALRPRTFHWRSGINRDTKKRQIGLVAQEAEQAMPDIVFTAPPGVGDLGDGGIDDLRVVDVSNITYALINAVKTLNARIAALEAA